MLTNFKNAINSLIGLLIFLDLASSSIDSSISYCIYKINRIDELKTNKKAESSFEAKLTNKHIIKI